MNGLGLQPIHQLVHIVVVGIEGDAVDLCLTGQLGHGERGDSRFSPPGAGRLSVNVFLSLDSAYPMAVAPLQFF